MRRCQRETPHYATATGTNEHNGASTLLARLHAKIQFLHIKRMKTFILLIHSTSSLLCVRHSSKLRKYNKRYNL